MFRQVDLCHHERLDIWLISSFNIWSKHGLENWQMPRIKTELTQSMILTKRQTKFKWKANSFERVLGRDKVFKVIYIC